MRTHRPRSAPIVRSAFAGFRFPPDVIVLAVRWYLRYGLSYRDVEELLTKDRDRRACLRAERSARLLRAGGRGAGEPAVGGRVRRAGLGDLIPGRAELQHAATWQNATARFGLWRIDPAAPGRPGRRQHRRARLPPRRRRWSVTAPLHTCRGVAVRSSGTVAGRQDSKDAARGDRQLLPQQAGRGRDLAVRRRRRGVQGGGQAVRAVPG